MLLKPKSLHSMRAAVELAQQFAADETNENWQYLRGYADGSRALLDVLIASLNESMEVKL